jgi:hypothetical protein
MDSYLGKLKSMKQKLASAAQHYIPKDIIKHVP